MKVVILAGGFGTRISEESYLKPKPMIEIGGMPILWHIMKMFYQYGYDDFIICAGYKQHIIKEWFANYYLHRSDITFDFSQNNKMIIHSNYSEAWKVTIVDTGLETLTGGRIKRIKKYINDETFIMTYGDGLSDIDVKSLVEFHNSHKRIATLSAVIPQGRFGMMDIDGDVVKTFREKSREDVGWINGGFMVLNKEVFDYIDGDLISFEKEPLEKLAKEEQLCCYKHSGFWQCMDTMRDKEYLEKEWATGNAKWKNW